MEDLIYNSKEENQNNQYQMIVDDGEDNSPLVFSWGRSDNYTLLRKSEGDTVDGITTYRLPKRVILQIASSEYHTACLTATGDVLICGSNEEGQSSLDYDDMMITKPRLFELGNHRITSIAVGLFHTVCVTASGVAISFGGNELGQVGHSASKMTKTSPSKVDFNCKGKNALVVQKACCGDLFTLFLTTTGEVYGCGSGANLGNPQSHDTTVADRIEGLVGSNIISIAAGSSHAFALSSNGELYGWGTNQHGQLGIGTDANHSQTPVLIPLPSSMRIGKVIGVSCGANHSIIWTDAGVVLGSGSNKYGQLGCAYPRVNTFTILENITSNNTSTGSDKDSISDPLSCGCVQATCGRNHTLVLTIDPTTKNNKIFGFGSNNFGQAMPSSTASIIRQPTLISELDTVWNVQRVLYISAGGDQSFLVAAPFGVESTGSVMKKQFSTLASRSVTPMSASELMETLSEAHRQTRLVGSSLSIVAELFSSSSLLAASFRDPNITNDITAASQKRIDPNIAVDVSGLEACYVSLMHLGNAAVVKLLAALQSTLTSLETIVPTNVSVVSEQQTNSNASSLNATSGSTDSTTSDNQSNGSNILQAYANIPESIVRTLLIVWMCPVNGNAALSSDVFPRLTKLLCNLPPNLRMKLVELIADIPPHLFASRILKSVQEHLSLVVDKASDGNADPNLPLYCLVLNWLYVLAKTTNIVPMEQFYNESVSRLPDEILLRDFLGWKDYHLRKQTFFGRQSTAQPFFISNHPFILSADAKRRILLAENLLQQQNAQHQAFATGVLGAQSHGGIAYINPWFILPVNRENLLQTTLIHIESASDTDLKKPLKVVFEGEEGIDEGGVTKEFFQLLVGQLFSPQYGMFLPTADLRGLWINRASLWNKQEFHLVGILLGLAVYNGVLLDIHLPKVFYRKLLHRPLDLSDVMSIDSELAKGLQQLLDYQPAQDVEHVFCRTFEVRWDVYGEERSEELIPGGANIPVTDANRQQYVEKYISWLLTDSIQTQFDALFQGFTKVVTLSSLLLLSPEELELLMVGQPHLDFKELQSHTAYVGDNNWGPQHPTIEAFWQVLHSLPFEMKQKFLLFVTGSSKAPIGGLAKLGLKIQRMGPDSDNLPTAHTCFNTLLLPEYGSLDKVRDRLMKAIEECEGFGLK